MVAVRTVGIAALTAFAALTTVAAITVTRTALTRLAAIRTALAWFASFSALLAWLTVTALIGIALALIALGLLGFITHVCTLRVA